MASETTNYKLVKPDPEEFYDVGVQNSNLDKIDTALKELEDNKASSTDLMQLQQEFMSHSAEKATDAIRPHGMGSIASHDYEEGIFTPYFGGSSTDGTITYLVQTGRYIKVGRKVTIMAKLKIDTITTVPTGTKLYIRGLPFSMFDDGLGVVIPYANIDIGSNTKQLVAFRSANTVLELQTMENNNTFALLQPSILAPNSEVVINLTYRTP